eukprot:gene27588-36301_t
MTAVRALRWGFTIGAGVLAAAAVVPTGGGASIASFLGFVAGYFAVTVPVHYAAIRAWDAAHCRQGGQVVEYGGTAYEDGKIKNDMLLKLF